jgi:hypothetical protein
MFASVPDAQELRRRVTRPGHPSALLAFALCLLPATVHAGPRTFTLDYMATGECPSESAMLGQFRDRAPSAERVRHDGAVSASMRVRAESGRAHGNIEWRRGDMVVRRSLDGADCSEVVAALALILALALDSEDDSFPAQGSTERSRAETSQRRPAWHAAFAVVGGATSGVGPKLRAYFGVRGGIWRNADGVWAPRAELSGAYAGGTSRTAAGEAELRWWTARLGLCPFEVGTTQWYARPCASFDLGRLSARGYATRLARAAAAPWYGPGVLVATGTRALSALALGVEAGVVFPLARDRFYFEPDQTAARIPEIAGYGGITLGVEP